LLTQLEGDETAARRERAGQPDATIAAERADLENFVGAAGQREHLEHAPLQWRDGDLGHVVGRGGLKCRLKRLILGREERCELRINELAGIGLLAQEL